MVSCNTEVGKDVWLQVLNAQESDYLVIARQTTLLKIGFYRLVRLLEQIALVL